MLPRFLAHLTGWTAATVQDRDAQTWGEGHEFSLDKLNLKGWRRQEGSWITRDEVQRQVHNGGSGHRLHGNNEIPARKHNEKRNVKGCQQFFILQVRTPRFTEEQ